ncbi:hypothetical protein HDU98_005936 [Podochytrium sp. JEL0797]|nr:hypothetical protein HDU98_005936 [Podochytrium sp. JEL0797]
MAEPSVKEQIARLQSAISQKKALASSSHPAPPRNPPQYPTYPAYLSYSSYPARPPPQKFRNKSLVVTNTEPKHVKPGESIPPIAAAPVQPVETKPELPKFITKGNKLIRAGVGACAILFQIQVGILNSKQRAVVKKVPDINESYTVFKGGITKVFNKPAKPVVRKSPHGKRQVVINGIEFKLDPSRRKLVRVQANTPSTNTTPKRITINSKTFIRSKAGNLIPSKRHPHHPKTDPSKTHCKHYQTGRCQLAHKCPYLHDPLHRLICRKHMTPVGCEKGATCKLSHVPTVHNTPVCVHFMTAKGCTHADCKYVHVKPTCIPTAEVCVPFARRGYCDAVDCKERHVWLCPDADAGRPCSKGDKCRLAPCSLERKGMDVSRFKRKVVQPDVVQEEDVGVEVAKVDCNGLQPQELEEVGGYVSIEGDEEDSSEAESEQEDDEMEEGEEEEGKEEAGSEFRIGNDVIDLDWGDDAEGWM